MNDNLMVIVRYAISVIAGIAASKGWLTTDQANGVVNFVIQAVTWGVAAIPPVRPVQDQQHPEGVLTCDPFCLPFRSLYRSAAA